MSFSGSTLLNYVLGSHSGVYGASEIYSLIHPINGSKGYCSWCEDDCPVLSKKNLDSIRLKTFYSDLARFSGKQLIVDSSKHLWWFEEAFAAQSSKSFQPIFLILTKHPMRHLASFMGFHPNHLRASGLATLIKQSLKDPINALSSERLHISYWLGVMLDYYTNLFSNPLLNEYPTEQIRYEDFVLTPAEALEKTLAFFDTPYSAEALKYENFEHHGYGGNSSVMRNVRDYEEWEKHWKEHFPPWTVDFFKECDGIQLDNTHEKAFSPKVQNWIYALPKYKQLCALLGYPAQP